MRLVKTRSFHGIKKGKEDLQKLLEDIKWVTPRVSGTASRCLETLRILFRRLPEWGQGLNSELETFDKGNWRILQEEFRTHFKLQAKTANPEILKCG